MKKTLSLLLIVSGIFLQAAVAFAGSFSDVAEGSFYYVPIENLKALGIVKGYDDGTFKPDQPVNRAEALKMILKGRGLTIDPGLYSTGLTDVALDVWYAGYVMEGMLRGIVQGNPDGTFAGARNVNKAEFLKMTLKAFEISAAEPPAGTLIAADVKSSDWFARYLWYARNTGIVFPNLDNKLEPGKNLTRAECVEILFKMMLLAGGGETQKMLNMTEARLADSVIQIKAGNLAAALQNANEAAFYADTALKQDSTDAKVKAANSISIAFIKLYLAYKAATENDNAKVESLVAEAKSFAAQAVTADETIKPLADEITAQGDKLLSQISGILNFNP